MKTCVKVFTIGMFWTTFVHAQYQTGVNNNVTLFAQVHQYGGYASVWGYTDGKGREYALLGADRGLSIINITDPRNPIEVDFVPGPVAPPYHWREIKTYQNFAYVVSEGTSPNQYTGIQVLDLSTLPDSVAFYHSVLWPGVTAATGNAHTISVDDAGYLYVQGGNATLGVGNPNASGGGVRIFSLADPLVPISVGFYGEQYVHDSYVKNNILFNSNIFEPTGGRVDILDVSDRAQPRLLTSLFYPQGFTHNSWTTEDGNYLFTTDERAGTTVKVWDIHVLWDNDASNDRQIELVAEYISNPQQIAHNIHIRGNYAYLAHYAEGARIVDIHDPEDPVEVGFIDTYLPPNHENFIGAWGIYPYFPSGNFVISDMVSGLYVCRFDSAKVSGRGGIFGLIKNHETGRGLHNATLHFVEASKTRISGGTGAYQPLRTYAGKHTVIISRVGFFTDTLNVDIPATATNMRFDHELRPENAFIAIEVDTIRAEVAPGKVRQGSFDIRNTGTGTLRYSVRDINGPGFINIDRARRPRPDLRLAQSKLLASTMAPGREAKFSFQDLKEIIKDSTGDVFGGAEPDIVSVLAEKGATAITLKVKFNHPPSLDSTLVLGFALDTDGNPNTGQTLTGVYFNDLGPEFDVLLSIQPLPALGFPAYTLGIYDNLRFTRLLRTNAVLAGSDSSVTTTIALSDLRNDDGNMNVVASAYHWPAIGSGSPLSEEIAPDEGHGTIGLDPFEDAVWLSESPHSGSIVGVGSANITMQFDATQLEAGSYSALLVVNSNDPVNFEKRIPVRLRVDPLVKVEQESESPRTFALLQNQPNPFRQATHIEFALSVPTEVQMYVYNLQGQLVRQVASGKFAAGKHQVRWDATDAFGRRVASGVYVYVLETPAHKIMRKLLVIR